MSSRQYRSDGERTEKSSSKHHGVAQLVGIVLANTGLGVNHSGGIYKNGSSFSFTEKFGSLYRYSSL
jgi:hypothetical protein